MALLEQVSAQAQVQPQVWLAQAPVPEQVPEQAQVRAQALPIQSRPVQVPAAHRQMRNRVTAQWRRQQRLQEAQGPLGSSRRLTSLSYGDLP